MNSITTLSLNTVFGGNDNSNLCPNCETMLNNFRNHNNISHYKPALNVKIKMVIPSYIILLDVL